MRDTYVHNFARTLAGQLGLKAYDYRYAKSAAEIAQAIISPKANWWNMIHQRIPTNPESRCNLADAGVGVMPCEDGHRVTLGQVHAGQEWWISQSWYGRDIVKQVAATAVVAAMADNFWDECERQRDIDSEFLVSHGSIRSDPDTRAMSYGRDRDGHGWAESQE